MDEKILNLQKLYDNINTRISLLENNMLSVLSNSQNNTINATLAPTHTKDVMYENNNTSTQSVLTSETDEIIPKKKKDNILRKRTTSRHIIY